MNHYDVLGLKRTAKKKEIKAAYQRAARLTHPDITGGTSEAYEAVRLAWETLSHPAARHGYDTMLDAGQVPPLPAPQPARTPSPQMVKAGLAYYAQPPARATIVVNF